MASAGETVAVVGALGTQGASVIRALSSSPTTSHWKIRALTSSPDSEPARALNDQENVTIVQCDVNDLESICSAFTGCTHIFANTLFPAQTMFAEGQQAAAKVEHDHGMSLMRAAAETTTLRHLVWSTLMDGTVTSQAKWRVPHFMSKQGANAYICGGYPGYEGALSQEEPGWGTLRDKSTLMAIGVYGTNFRNHTYRPLRKPDSDDYVILLPCPPDVPFSIAGDESKNVGILVRAIFEQPEKSVGRWINCESEQISCRQWVATLEAAAQSQGLNRSVTFEECTMESIEDRWGVLGNEIGQMMAYIGDTKERSFKNTTDLPTVTASQLGVASELVMVKDFYNNLDCLALFKEVDAGETHLGTASR